MNAYDRRSRRSIAMQRIGGFYLLDLSTYYLIPIALPDMRIRKAETSLIHRTFAMQLADHDLCAGTDMLLYDIASYRPQQTASIIFGLTIYLVNTGFQARSTLFIYLTQASFCLFFGTPQPAGIHGLCQCGTDLAASASKLPADRNGR